MFTWLDMLLSFLPPLFCITRVTKMIIVERLIARLCGIQLTNMLQGTLLQLQLKLCQCTVYIITHQNDDR